MPSVYISHSASPWELAQVQALALALEANQQGLVPFLPDRNWNPGMGLPSRLATPLQGADVILVFATSSGRYSEWVNSELAQVPSKTRVIALVERDVQVSGIDPRDILEFDRSEDMSQVIQKVTGHIQGLHLQQETSNLVTGLVIGGLILLLLRGLGGKGGKG